MKDINIKDIIELVMNDVHDAERVIEKSFGWYYERTISLIKGMVGIALTLLVALLISHFKNELHGNVFELYAAFIFPIGLLLYGVYRYWRLRRLAKEYFSALSLYKSFVKISNFLKLYKNS